jgi:hypothetical protein
MSEYWEDKFKEQKEHYEGFISTLHEIIRQKKERIEHLETLLEQKLQRETPPYLKSDIDALKLMLQQQLRINQSLRASHWHGVMKDAQTQAEEDSNQEHERYSRIDHTITSLSLCMRDIMKNIATDEDIPLDPKTKRLQYITTSLKRLKTIATTLEIECKNLTNKKETLLKKIRFLEQIVQETSIVASRKIKAFN